MIQVPHFRQERAKTCLPASVRMVLDYLGIQCSEDLVAKLLHSTSTGTNVMNIELLPEEWGLKVWTGEISPDVLKGYIDQEIPVIVVVETPALPHRDARQRRRHTLVVVGYEPNPSTSMMACYPTPRLPSRGATF